MMKNKWTFALFLAGIFCFSISNFCFGQSIDEVSKQGNHDPLQITLSKSFSARNYILGPNDIISISVYESPEFEQKSVRIQPDGKITIVPLGSIYVSGNSIEDLEKLLADKYRFYLNDPQITIKLEQTKPFIVYVTGAVVNPGSYELNTDTSKVQYTQDSKPEIQIDRKAPILSNVLLAAGGISYDADLEHIRISNKIDNYKYEINLLNLIDKQDVDQDIYLMAGDAVYVPKLPTPLAISDELYKKYASASFSPRQIPVKVFGYVNSPGLIKLDSAHSLNINSAITSAGGYLQDSAYAPNKVYLSRVDANGKLVTTIVNPMSNDFMLRPNDIIYVPEKSRPLIGKTVDYLVRVFTPFNTFASTYNNWALMFDPHRYQVVGK